MTTQPCLDTLEQARQIRARRTGKVITYSRKVFIPLTNLCRDSCGYCTFVRRPGDPKARTLTPEEVLQIAHAGKRAGCREALFSLGERPELRYPEYRDWLRREQACESTVEYLARMCRLVLEETGLLPHANPGTLSDAEIRLLQPFCPSMGMMLESASTRLLQPGQAHHACPDKVPATRLKTLEAAGRAGVPFTTGILIGIGETVKERAESIESIRRVHERYGHIQEVIVQNFRAKSDTRFADWPEPGLADLMNTAAEARILLGDSINLQVPPNLSPDDYGALLACGINDWGGVSPVTLDHINPEKAWPQLDRLRQVTAEAGFELRERLCVYPEHISQVLPAFPQLAALTDESGLVRRELELW